MVSEVSFGAIGLLVGVSVFTTGFVSVRLHAQRDRAIDRIDAAMERLGASASMEAPMLAGRVEEIVRALRVGSEADVVAKATLAGNVLILLLVAGLAAAAAESAGSPLRLELWDLDPESWALLSGVLAQVFIVGLGFLDLRWVARDLRRQQGSNPILALDVAATAARDGRHEEAVDHYTQVIGQVPSWPWPYRGRAISLLAWGHPTAALVDYESLAEFGDLDAATRVDRGRCLIAANRLAEALEELDLVIAEESGDVVLDARLERGRCLLKADRAPEAFEDFKIVGVRRDGAKNGREAASPAAPR